ncbi:MAG: 2-succinyl-6-hydroxy-2,4-cyclohexadiene-1-carboxylate synthase [Puniceicoccales bacterium]
MTLEAVRRWWKNVNRKPAVLALHGFIGCGRDFEPVIEKTTGEISWWTLDLPGHGVSHIKPPYRLETFLEQIEQARALVVEETGERPILLGYSMGGRLALHAAARAPEHWRALITIGATPGIDDETERATRLQADAERAQRMRGQSIDAFLAEWASEPIIQSQENIPRAIREAMLERRRQNAPHPLAEALEALSPGALPSLWGELNRLALPCLFVAGENDPKFSAIAERMATAVPNAHAEIIPEAGHCAHLEKSWPCTSKLIRFIDDLPQTGDA